MFPKLRKIALSLIVLATLIPCTGFRPFRDESKGLLPGGASAASIDSHAELYTMIRIESDGTVLTDQWLLMFLYRDGATHCIWRILPNNDKPSNILYSVQEKGSPLRIYLRENDDRTSREVTDDERASTFAQTDWNIEDIYDDEKKTWVHTPRGRSVRSGEEVILFESRYADPEIRLKSYYDHRVTVINAQDRSFLQADYYDPNDKRVKSIQGSLHHKVGPAGKEQIRPMRLIITDFRDDSLTVMVVSRASFNGNIPENYFTLDAINNWNTTTDQELLTLLSPITKR